jgi:phage gp29-like protein
MADSPIVDTRGRPIRKAELKQELAAPSMTGVRQVWHNGIASHLTPDRLGSILRAAENNDGHDYLTLAEEMEEREPHYASVIGTRKRAVSGLDVVVEAASDDPADVKLADAVRDLVRDAAFSTLIEDLLDALGKGYSVAEILWQTRGREWWPREYVWRDPRFFRFDQATGRELRLIDLDNVAQGIALAPYKFIVHRPRLKTGVTLRGGLARLVAVSYMAKSYTLTDWLAFAEVFGMPLRLGRYNANAKPDEVDILRAAVANLGSDAAAILPEGMKIEFKEIANTQGGADLFKGLAEWLDKQTSKAVLGQTMTADDGSSHAQANVHNDVREDIQRADAHHLSGTLNRDLVKPFVDLNYGMQRR